MVYSSQPAKTETFSARVCLAVSNRPEGPFENMRAPLFDNDWSCIDGHLFIDSDASPYLYFTDVGVTQENSKRYLSGVNYGANLSIEDDGSLKLPGPTRSPQPLPSGL